MAKKNIFSDLVINFFKKTLSVPENKSTKLDNPRKFIIIRQHNQLGDLLAGVSVFRAIKETYPQSHITLILSPVNYQGLIKNKFIDRIFVFDKKKIFNPFYLSKFIKLIREGYDAAIVPVVVSISFTSNLLCRLTKAKTRIGPLSLDDRINESAFFFDRRVKLNFERHPDSNVADRSLEIVRPFGINTNELRSEITFDGEDISAADEFINKLNLKAGDYLVGIHPGAGKIQNRWSFAKYAALIKKLNESFPVKFYLTGSNTDNEALVYLQKNCGTDLPAFKNRKIPEVAALVAKSDLFIANDTGIMHVAGTTQTPQVSIFGPTNPFNWAPIGSNKIFIRKSELIDDISVQDVFEACEALLIKKKAL